MFVQIIINPINTKCESKVRNIPLESKQQPALLSNLTVKNITAIATIDHCRIGRFTHVRKWISIGTSYPIYSC
jgi:hypothetical protein